MRLADMRNSGRIAGAIPAGLLNGECATPEGRFIYVFAGGGVEITEMLNDPTRPLTSVPVESDNGSAHYEVAFLPAGNYTLGFTCNGDIDQPFEENGVKFARRIAASVHAGDTTTADFK
jgi:hypothetical protein